MLHRFVVLQYSTCHNLRLASLTETHCIVAGERFFKVMKLSTHNQHTTEHGILSQPCDHLESTQKICFKVDARSDIYGI